MKVEFSRYILEKCSNIKCLKTLSSGSRDVLSGQKDSRTERQTDGIEKAIVTFRSFVNAPKN